MVGIVPIGEGCRNGGTQMFRCHHREPIVRNQFTQLPEWTAAIISNLQFPPSRMIDIVNIPPSTTWYYWPGKYSPFAVVQLESFNSSTMVQAENGGRYCEPFYSLQPELQVSSNIRTCTCRGDRCCLATAPVLLIGIVFKPLPSSASDRFEKQYIDFCFLTVSTVQYSTTQ